MRLKIYNMKHCRHVYNVPNASQRVTPFNIHWTRTAYTYKIIRKRSKKQTKKLNDTLQPSLHDLRKVRVGSISFLILINASSTIGPHVLRSTWYSCIRGLSRVFSGFYVKTRDWYNNEMLPLPGKVVAILPFPLCTCTIYVPICKLGISLVLDCFLLPLLEELIVL